MTLALWTGGAPVFSNVLQQFELEGAFLTFIFVDWHGLLLNNEIWTVVSSSISSMLN
jgi:hypothetical protein